MLEQHEAQTELKDQALNKEYKEYEAQTELKDQALNKEYKELLEKHDAQPVFVFNQATHIPKKIILKKPPKITEVFFINKIRKDDTPNEGVINYYDAGNYNSDHTSMAQGDVAQAEDNPINSSMVGGGNSFLWALANTVSKNPIQFYDDNLSQENPVDILNKISVQDVKDGLIILFAKENKLTYFGYYIKPLSGELKNNIRFMIIIDDNYYPGKGVLPDKVIEKINSDAVERIQSNSSAAALVKDVTKKASNFVRSASNMVKGNIDKLTQGTSAPNDTNNTDDADTDDAFNISSTNPDETLNLEEETAPEKTKSATKKASNPKNNSTKKTFWSTKKPEDDENKIIRLTNKYTEYAKKENVTTLTKTYLKTKLDETEDKVKKQEIQVLIADIELKTAKYESTKSTLDETKNKTAPEDLIKAKQERKEALDKLKTEEQNATEETNKPEEIESNNLSRVKKRLEKARTSAPNDTNNTDDADTDDAYTGDAFNISSTNSDGTAITRDATEETNKPEEIESNDVNEESKDANEVTDQTSNGPKNRIVRWIKNAAGLFARQDFNTPQTQRLIVRKKSQQTKI